MKSNAQRGRHRSLGIIAVVIAVLCLFSVFAIHLIRARSVSEKSDMWMEQAESAEQLANDLAQRVGMTDLMSLNSAQIGKYYAVSNNTAEQAVVYTDATESELREIAVFRVSSKPERDAVMNAVNTRVSAFSSAYNFTNAENTEKKYFVGNSGSYVLLIIGVPYALASEAVLEES